MAYQLSVYWTAGHHIISWLKISVRKKKFKVENDETFGVQLADRLEVLAVGKMYCFVNLGPMKTSLTFYVLNYNIPCVLGIPFL